MTKTQKGIITLAIVLVLLGGAYMIWNKVYQENKDDEQKAFEKKQKLQLNQFKRELKGWTTQICRAKKSKTPGWEEWYMPEDTFEQKTRKLQLLKKPEICEQEAYFQILDKEPHKIPVGYKIHHDGSRWDLVQTA